MRMAGGAVAGKGGLAWFLQNSHTHTHTPPPPPLRRDVGTTLSRLAIIPIAQWLALEHV